jgi:hypothetical protein
MKAWPEKSCMKMVFPPSLFHYKQSEEYINGILEHNHKKGEALRVENML